MVGLRPESLEIGGDGGINAEVEVVEELGADDSFCNDRDRGPRLRPGQRRAAWQLVVPV
jgi:hypothetical protein